MRQPPHLALATPPPIPQPQYGSPPHPPISTTQEYDAAVNRMIELEQHPGSEHNTELNALAAAVAAYDEAHTPEPELPRTLRGILKLEMYKRRLKQRGIADLLEIHESRLSELLKGKREMSIDVACKLYSKLHIPAETVLTLQG